MGKEAKGSEADGGGEAASTSLAIVAKPAKGLGKGGELVPARSTSATFNPEEAGQQIEIIFPAPK